jgi:hypothetical protein
MKIIVSVNEKHIANGKAENAGSCPIALAIKELLPKKKSNLRVRACVVGFSRVIRKAILPVEAKEFIKAFDAGKKVKPFIFLLEIPKTHLRKQFLEGVV